jgi:hypothetical protein
VTKSIFQTSETVLWLRVFPFFLWKANVFSSEVGTELTGESDRFSLSPVSSVRTRTDSLWQIRRLVQCVRGQILSGRLAS